MQRYDIYTIQAVKTDEGFIRDKPIVGRVGLLTYMRADGTTRIEYRPPDEAFNADSLQSLMGKPITVGHKAMVTSKNVDSVNPVGSVLTAGVADGDNIRADIMIYKLDTNARELSCGYSLDLDETPGVTPDGKRYDAVQRNIRYNHVAIVGKGRAGNARLNMDGEQVFCEESEEVNRMKKIKLDNGIEYDAAPEVVVAFDAMQSELQDEKKKAETLTAEKDVLQAKVDALKAEKKEMEKAHKDSIDAAINERVSMLEIAKNHNIDKVDTLTNEDIKKAVITAVHGDSINLDGKSADYIQAMYDMAKDDTKNRSDSMAKQRQQAKGGNREDSKELTIQELYEKMRADEAQAYLKGDNE